jgi:hypothetical protein
MTSPGARAWSMATVRKQALVFMGMDLIWVGMLLSNQVILIRQCARVSAVLHPLPSGKTS